MRSQSRSERMAPKRKLLRNGSFKPCAIKALPKRFQSAFKAPPDRRRSAFKALSNLLLSKRFPKRLQSGIRAPCEHPQSAFKPSEFKASTKPLQTFYLQSVVKAPPQSALEALSKRFLEEHSKRSPRDFEALSEHFQSVFKAFSKRLHGACRAVSKSHQRERL